MNVITANSRTTDKYSDLEDFEKNEISGIVYGRNTETIPVFIDKEVFEQKFNEHPQDLFDLVIDDGTHIISELGGLSTGSTLIENNVVTFRRVTPKEFSCKKVPIFLQSCVDQDKIRCTQYLEEVMIYGRPSKLSDGLWLDVSNLLPGEKLLLGEIHPPEGVAFADEDLNKLVVSRY